LFAQAAEFHRTRLEHRHRCLGVVRVSVVLTAVATGNPPAPVPATSIGPNEEATGWLRALPDGGREIYAKTACMAAPEALASRWNWSRSHRRWTRFSCIFMDRLVAYPERKPPTTVPTTGRIMVPTPAPTIP